jgi:FkbM family methyltransferase
MNPLLLANKIYNRLFKMNLKLSFSQSGEDVIIQFIIHSLKRKTIQYFDVGTNDPRKSNNTYLLYINGHKGVCIEPNPHFYQQIKKHRPKDTLIQGGLALHHENSADFYIMDDSVLSTFSYEEVEKMQKEHGRKLVKVVKSPLFEINDIFQAHYIPNHDIILSIDVEGLDLDILKSIDFAVYQPMVICVETIEYTIALTGTKKQDIFDFLYAQNYRVFADTYINTIFLLNSF